MKCQCPLPSSDHKANKCKNEARCIVIIDGVRFALCYDCKFDKSIAELPSE